MFELDIKELQLIVKTMSGFTGVESMMLCSKLIAEVQHREEVESLDFEEDCLSCKL
tara:strand:- start:5796 stop:5963 length:168 start_codon:yes stop_codon:yes gene_type:complete